MADFFDDPQFPDRPQHPDFWRLVDVVNKLDGRTIEDGVEIPQMFTDIIDYESLEYMAEQRVGAHFGFLPRSMQNAMVAAFITAFAAGVEFERAGGKQ